MRRRVGFLFIFGAIAPLMILVSAAWACGILATLKAAPSRVAPGQTVGVAGGNYAAPPAPPAAGGPAPAPTFTPVQIRLDRRGGRVLKEVTPTPSGKLPAGTTVALPSNTRAGDHVLLATQAKISDGTPKAGTPGRTVVRVKGAAAGSSAPAASPWGTPKPGAPGGSAVSADVGGLDGSPLLAVALSLSLLSIGLTLVSRDKVARGGRRRPLLGA